MADSNIGIDGSTYFVFLLAGCEMTKLFIKWAFQAVKINFSYFSIQFTHTHRLMFRLDDVAPLTITFQSGQTNDTQLYFNGTGKLERQWGPKAFFLIEISFIFSEFIEILCDRHIKDDHSMRTNWPIWHSNADKRQRKTCQFNVHIDATKSTGVRPLRAYFTHTIRKSIAEATSDVTVGKEVNI